MRALTFVPLAFLIATLPACAFEHESKSAPLVGSTQLSARQCADGATLPGIDVSAWQDEDFPWEAVAQGPDARFAFIRLGHGLTGDGFSSGPDAHFDSNWAEAKRVGLLRGAYQYFDSTQSATAQADMLIEKIMPLEDGDLPPVLDVEFREGEDIASVPEIIAGIETWLVRVENALGVKPIIYTSQYMWEQMTDNTTMFSDYPLWVANYGVDCPLVPGGWTTWAFHQYSDSGGITGYDNDLDKNTFNGSSDDLMALATHETSEPTPPDAGVAPMGADAGDDSEKDLDSGGGCSGSGSGQSGLLSLLLLAGALLSWRKTQGIVRF